MRNSVARALLGLSISLALLSGAAMAKASEENPKPATKTAPAKKSVSSAKDASARRARIKKIGSAATKETMRRSQPAKASVAALVKNNQPGDAHIASNSDGGSVAERRARIHSMRVPE